MVIIVYAHLTPEAMYEKGKQAGLSDEAANFFRYFQEVTLSLEVEESTGKVWTAKVVDF